MATRTMSPAEDASDRVDGLSRARTLAKDAAEQAARLNSINMELPIVGEIELPSKEELAFLGGLVAMAIVGLVEWPVAVLLGVGHTLAHNRHNKIIREFGQALEEA